MAAHKTAKKTAQKAAKKAGKKAGKEAGSQRGATRVTSSEAKGLRALDASYQARPDVGVKAVLDEARDLRKTATKDGAALAHGTELEGDFAGDLGVRTDLLERAEGDWDDLRTRRGELPLTAARAAAEEQKRPAARALRYFLRGDREVQARLDEITLGSGDADLIDDLKRLANLVEGAGPALAKAKLPAGAAGKLRAAADALAEASSGAAAATEGGDAIVLRNLAFWHVRELMDEIRAAGRYVFSGDARRLARYLSTQTLARKRARPRKPKV